jgi:hypothetical protein
MTMDLIDGRQCAAARAMLGMPQHALSTLAGLGQNTVTDFERGERVHRRSTALAIRSVLEAQGIRFVFSDAERGVMLAISSSEVHQA